MALTLTLLIPVRLTYAAPRDTTPPGSEEKQRDPCAGEEGYEESWLDRSHKYLSRQVCEPAVWFDSFFGDKRADAEGYPGSFLRLRNEFRYSDDEHFDFRLRVHAQIRLPKATRRLSLILSGENEEDSGSVLPGDPTSPGQSGGTDPNLNNLGFRYEIVKTPRSKFYVQPGLRLTTPPDPFVRLRYRYTYPISPELLSRFTQTLFWFNTDGFGASTRVDLERLLDKITLLRWSNSGTYSETSSGLDWGSEISFFQQLAPRVAINFDIGVSGFTEPEIKVDTYRVGYRFRVNFFKTWLFYEIQPELRWPKDDPELPDVVGAITFLLEIQLGYRKK